MSDDALVEAILEDLRAVWKPGYDPPPRRGVQLLVEAHAKRLDGPIRVAYEINTLVVRVKKSGDDLGSLRRVEAWLEKARPPALPVAVPQADGARPLVEHELRKRVDRFQHRLADSWGGEERNVRYVDGVRSWDLKPRDRTDFAMEVARRACQLAREDDVPEVEPAPRVMRRKLGIMHPDVHAYELGDCRERVLKRAAETDSATVRRCLLAYAECLEAERKAGPEEAVPITPAAERRARELVKS